MTAADTGRCLLRAVCENPADDLPRLVYADWLEERESQRVECASCKGSGWTETGFEKMGGPHDDDRHKRYVFQPARGRIRIGCQRCGGTVTERGQGTVLDTTDRERARFIRDSIANPGVCYFRKLYDLGHALHGGLDDYLEGSTAGPNTMNPETTGLVWHRGFVSEVRTTCEQFMRRAGDLFASQPVVSVRLVDREPMHTIFTDLCSWIATEGWENLPPHFVPREFYRGGFLTEGHVKEGCYTYPTPAAAHAALAAACVRVGRQRAGLGPLPTAHG